MKSMRLVFFIVLAFFANAVLAAPCARKEGEAERECIKQSSRDSNNDYLILASRIELGEETKCGVIEYRSQEFARCRVRGVSCDNPTIDSVSQATIFPKWERAQNSANVCELEVPDNCSLTRCRINFFVVLRIPAEASATAMGPQITDWEEPSIGSLLNVAPEKQ